MLLYYFNEIFLLTYEQPTYMLFIKQFLPWKNCLGKWKLDMLDIMMHDMHIRTLNQFPLQLKVM